MSKSAIRHRSKRLCPFNNKIPNCTKDKAQNPLGVCSILQGEDVVITCPVRFRQDWLIADDAAEFFFKPDATWTTLTEVKLKDAEGGSAGNIDVVLCAYDKSGKVYDFGALEGFRQSIFQGIFAILLLTTWKIQRREQQWIGGKKPIIHGPIIYRLRVNAWCRS